MIKRRDLVTLVGVAVAGWPLAVRAQQPGRKRRIGILFAAYTKTDQAGQIRIATFLKTLNALGWSDNTNLQVEYRWAGAAGGLAALAAELVQSAPEVIVVAGDLALTELQRLKTAIPVVFTQVSEPVDSGFVANLARPGANVTGFQNFEPAMGGKWLGLLKELSPSLRRVGALLAADVAPHASFLRAAELAAGALGITVVVVDVHDRNKIESAINAFAGEPDAGLLVFPHPNTIASRALINRLALRHRMPAIYPYRYFATDGGLAAYGPDQIDQWRGAASYVDRILRGEKPADLPVQAPTKFELVINLKTAKALGIEAPSTLLARADEVIE